jgi:flagellar basal-body rod modification protein FlgD
MAINPVSSATGAAASQSAFGLSFQSLLSIILTQLTYQDPLKPMDNFEFVSQLAQFAQLQQSQTLNTDVTSLLAAQSAVQATSLLGQTVDFTTAANSTAQTGVVQSVAFSNGQPTVTASVTTNGQTQTIDNIPIANITEVISASAK